MEFDFEVRKQFLPLMEDQARWTCVVAHRRAGKTCAAIQKLVISALNSDKPSPRFAFIAPLYKQAKAVSWDYLQHMTRDIPGTEINQSELRVDLHNGARIRLFGADNPDSLRGLYLDGVVMDEVAQMPVTLWSEVIRPALSDRKGWAYFSGTPKGKNTFWDIWSKAQDRDDWTTLMLKVDETGLLDDEEIDAAKKDMTEAEFAQEYMCSFEAAIRGAYYAKEMKSAEDSRRIGNVPYDPMLQVITSWDLGISDASVIWFYQVNGAEIRVINCKAYQGTGLPDIINDIKNLPYQYGQHIAPHDIRVTELGSGKTRHEIARGLGVDFTIAPNQRIAEGIAAVRTVLPRMWFDRDNCKDGIEALKQYKTEYDDKRQVFRANPLHDWTSDYADSMRYFAITPIIVGNNSEFADWNVAIN